MARTGPIPISFVAAILLGIVLSPSAPATEQSPWLEVHSTHFTVITDAGEKKGTEVALRFEQMRAVFATLLMKQRLNEPVPLTILAFKNDKDYYQTAPLRQGQPIHAPGFFLPGEDHNFTVLNLLEEESWRAVAHDFAHLLLNYNYPEVQGWFDEGLVEYFSSIRVGDKKYDIGGDPEPRSAFTKNALQNQTEAGNPSKSLTELLGSHTWLALPDLFNTRQDASTHAEGTRRTLFYAQSWMTMHYLLHEKKLPETGTYFDLVENQHVPVEEAIQKAYGVTSAQLDQAVKDYFHAIAPQLLALDAPGQTSSQNNAPQIYQFPEIVGPEDSAITSKFLPETDARAIVDEVRIRIPDRRDAALQDLQALATAPNPTPVWKAADKNKDDKSTLPVAIAGNEIAHRILAWDHLQHGEFDDAAEELGNAAGLNRDDMWIRYYFSVLKYRMAQSKHGDILGLPNMMQDLRAVLEWYPEFAEADDLMARARMEGGGPAGAMQAERAAIQLSPRNQQYVYHLAEIYVADKKWEAARSLLQRLIEQGKTGSNPQIAAAASERLAQLATEQKYGVSPATAAAASKLSKPSSPFDVLEQDAAKRAAAEQASQSGVADKRPTKFFQGRLVDVDCSQSPAAVLTVSSGGAVLKLRTADYKSLLLIGADNFSCEWNNRSVSVNYKSGGMSDGDLVSLEVR
jgi:tetratricopeptide (TPR) repeat protein